jgi:hypothetical protein
VEALLYEKQLFSSAYRRSLQKGTGFIVKVQSICKPEREPS